MAKKVELKHVLNRLASIYSDMYIVHNHVCIPGVESNRDSVGVNMVVFNRDMMELLNEKFDNKEVVFVDNVRKLKAAIDTEDEGHFFNYVKNKNNKEAIIKYMKMLKISIGYVTKWNLYEFTDEEKDALMDNRSIKMRLAEDQPELMVTKSAFPLLNKDIIDAIYYFYFLRN